MKWLNIHIPHEVADEVGKTAIRAGVCRAQAIAAALWIFSRLNTTERAAIIREYLYQRTEETNEPNTVLFGEETETTRNVVVDQLAR